MNRDSVGYQSFIQLTFHGIKKSRNIRRFSSHDFAYANKKKKSSFLLNYPDYEIYIQLYRLL